MKISGWQKIGLTFFLFIFLSVNLGSNFLVKPKEAKAFLGAGDTVAVISDTAVTTFAKLAAQVKHLTFDEIIRTLADAFWEEFKIRMINLLTARILDFIGANPDNPEKAKFVLNVAEYVWGSQLYGLKIPGLNATDTKAIWQALYNYFCGQPTAQFTINLFLPRRREKDFCEILEERFRVGRINYNTWLGFEDFSDFLLHFDEVTWQGQTDSAIEAANTYESRKEQEKVLEYLANKGLRSMQRINKEAYEGCLVWDRNHNECMDSCLSEKEECEEGCQGNLECLEECDIAYNCPEECKDFGECIKYRSTVTLPGAVIEQMSASAIHSTVQTITNIDIGGPLELGRVIAAVIELVANSAIDKIISNVEQDGLGLLDDLGKKHRTQDDFYSDFSEESREEYGFSTSTPSEEVIKWIEYKEQSKTIIEDQIIPTLKNLKKCLIKHNLPATVDGQSVDSLLEEYQNQLNQIETQLKEVKDNPEEYNEAKYGSPEEAKDEKTELSEKLDYYSNKLTECLAKPTPTINCLSISCDSNNVVTAEFAGDIRNENIIDYHLEIKIDDGDWRSIKDSCSLETTCSLPQFSCCLSYSQSDKTFQATVRYQGEAGKSYSIRAEIENENGWSDWATCSQRQCQ